jgi:carbamoyl-phosphate synthase small subunit
VAISDIDTRALTRQLRSAGVMRGVIATGAALDPRALVERANAIPKMEGSDLVQQVTSDRAFDWPVEDPDEFGIVPERRPKRRLKVAAYDFGMKWNIMRRLSAHGCDVRVYPAATPASEVLATSPDGVFLSNGPGDPAVLTYAIDSAKALVNADVPVFGICLGHQVLGLAMGGKTFKLKFGHRGKDRDHVAEPRLRRRPGLAACRRRGDPQEPVRRHGGGPEAPHPPGLLRAVPSRSVAGTA